MADLDPIGIEIRTRVAGNQQVQESVRNLQSMRQELSQFESIRLEAAQKYPESLEKQNRFIREQLSLLRQMENIGSRERLARLSAQKSEAIGVEQRRGIERQMDRERIEHARAQSEFAEAQMQRKQWEQQRGLGGWTDRGVDLTTLLTQAGIRGGPGAMVGAGLATVGRRAAGAMAGMGLAGRLAMGTGAGALLYGAYRAVRFVGEGMELNRQVYPMLADLMSGMRELPESAAQFRRELGLAAVNMGENVRQTITLQREWMRMGGLTEADTQTMSNAVLMGRAFGILPEEMTKFVGAMARTGYRPRLNPMLLPQAIRAATGAGIEGLRIPEFLEQIEMVTPALLGTAVTLDPAKLIGITARFADLGLPFQGQRGAQMMTSMHSAITQSGAGWEAARRVIQRRDGDVTLFDILRQQQRGLTDMENLREMLRIAQEQTRGRPLEDVAVSLHYLLGAKGPIEALYNPDEFRNSVMEMLLGIGKPLPGIGGTLTDEQIKERIAEYEETEGLKAKRYDVAKEVAKIETAAGLFELNINTFGEFVTNLVERGITVRLEGFPEGVRGEITDYEATIRRDVLAPETETKPQSQMVRNVPKP